MMRFGHSVCRTTVASPGNSRTGASRRGAETASPAGTRWSVGTISSDAVSISWLTYASGADAYGLGLRLEEVKTLNSSASGGATLLHYAHRHRPGGTAGSAPAPARAARACPAAWP